MGIQIGKITIFNVTFVFVWMIDMAYILHLRGCEISIEHCRSADSHFHSDSRRNKRDSYLPIIHIIFYFCLITFEFRVGWQVHICVFRANNEITAPSPICWVCRLCSNLIHQLLLIAQLHWQWLAFSFSMLLWVLKATIDNVTITST